MGASHNPTFRAETLHELLGAVAIVVAQQKLHEEHHGLQQLGTPLLDKIIQVRLHLVHRTRLLEELGLHQE